MPEQPPHRTLAYRAVRTGRNAVQGLLSCELCGALVVDEATHTRWHRSTALLLVPRDATQTSTQVDAVPDASLSDDPAPHRTEVGGAS